MDKKIELSIKTFSEIQKFLWFIQGFISHNEKIDSKIQERIMNQIELIDEFIEEDDIFK